MRAGPLRQRVTIKDKSVSQNTYGEEVITWTDVDTVWAAVEPLSGREFLEGKQITAEVSTRIRIRYRSGITPEMQVVFGSITYDIHSIIHIEEREREIHLMCQEIL
jgi:SPP1 family predicted phage head-tail adaptor